MNYFKMPNSVFECGLKANELVVLTYLCSIHKDESQSYVIAKYEAVSAACGYASKDSAQSVIRSLEQKGFITIVPRHNIFTGTTLSNGYIVNLHIGSRGYFKVDRKIFQTVVSRAGTTATAVYLYILRCMSNAKAAFPSLANIRDNVHVTIATIVKKLRELQAQLLLHKQNRRKANGSFGHNLYTLLLGSVIQKKATKKHVLDQRVFHNERDIKSNKVLSDFYCKAKSAVCQGGRYVKNVLNSAFLRGGTIIFRMQL